MIAQLTPRELAAWRLDVARAAPLVVDVREPWEFAVCRIEDSLHIPLGALPLRAGEIPHPCDLVLVCHHGVRSQQAAGWLARRGFQRLHNLRGGVAAWADEVEPTMPRY